MRGVVLCLLLGALGWPACTGWSLEPYTIEGLNKVYVPYFKNDTFYRRIEHDLTRQVIARIQSRPDLFLTDENSAELVIKGRIIDYQQRVLSENRNDIVTSASATISVEIKVVRARDGKVLKSEVLRDTAQFDQVLNETLETAQREAFFVLSQRIVDLLEEEI
ncbi:MAG: LPS assembly lipoprotein LptE [Planctomycetota bacterium]